MRSQQVATMFLFVAVLLLVSAPSAAAQENGSVGVRAGVSGDPGQFWIGGHKELRQVMDRVWFRPAAEIGFGDGMTLFSLDGEFVYHVRNKSPDWIPYAGLGPALIVEAFRSGQGDSGVRGGINFVAGIQEHQGLLVEVKIGAFHSPGFRVGIGWTW